MEKLHDMVHTDRIHKVNVRRTISVLSDAIETVAIPQNERREMRKIRKIIQNLNTGGIVNRFTILTLISQINGFETLKSQLIYLAEKPVMSLNIAKALKRESQSSDNMDMDVEGDADAQYLALQRRLTATANNRIRMYNRLYR